MNEGKPHFTFLLIHTREWLFYDDALMAWVWIVVLFIAEVVAAWGTYLLRRGTDSKFQCQYLWIGEK